MKFKIASILELVIPLSIALVLTAFLGCGGGGDYGSGTRAYDGTWYVNLKGYTLPGETNPSTGTVSCSERYTNIVISHGSGTVTQYMDCVNTASVLIAIDIGVTLTPDETGTTGVVKLETTGGGVTAGTCINRVVCSAKDFFMVKCGEAASGC